jgi:sporadic carbohydrate cluster protein (TIGR04323 family)
MTKVFGYVTSRPFGNFVMPVPAQNSCIREYCSTIEATYVLPPLEHKFKNCFMQLFTVGTNVSRGDIISMYSVEIVVSSDKALNYILQLLKKGVEFHFILENLHLKGAKSMSELKSYKIFKRGVMTRKKFKQLISQ